VTLDGHQRHEAGEVGRIRRRGPIDTGNVLAADVDCLDLLGMGVGGYQRIFRPVTLPWWVSNAENLSL